MTFLKYEQLRTLAEHVSSLDEFLEEIGQDPDRFTVPKWERGDYGQFYERIKGGHSYDNIKRHD